MYCVQCSQLCTITDWPFRDTKAYFRLTLFSINGLWLFYRAKWESNDEGEKINKRKKMKKSCYKKTSHHNFSLKKEMHVYGNRQGISMYDILQMLLKDHTSSFTCFSNINNV